MRQMDSQKLPQQSVIQEMFFLLKKRHSLVLRFMLL